MEIKSYKVLKVLNNNVILVQDNGLEKILWSNGLGFGKKIGDSIAINQNETKIFVLSNNENMERFQQLLSMITEQTLLQCQETIVFIEHELKKNLDERYRLNLLDHLAVTLKRLKEKQEIVNPFLEETEILYPGEFAIAEKAVRFLEKRTGIIIPDGEIGFIVLHIHSGLKQEKLSQTLKYTFLINSIIELVEEELNITLNRKNLDYARFIIHLRFGIQRILNHKNHKNDIAIILRNIYPQSYAIAKKVAIFLTDELGLEVNPEETGLLTIHIEKLKGTAV
jgi:transcriptional antiterminator